jgi:hypothetical protein
MLEATHQIAALRAEIPEEELRIFDAYYQERLALALREANSQARGTATGAADPDQVEAELIETLIREAEGRDDPEGLGLVPTAENENFIVPPESDPCETASPRRGKAAAQSGGAVGAMTPARWLAVGGLVLVCLAWLLFRSLAAPSAPAETARSQVPSGTASVVVTQEPTPIADVSVGKDITVSFPTSLEVGGQSGVFRIVASDGQLGGAWAPELQPGVAAWLKQTYINSIFCMPPESAALLAGLTRGQPILMRPASGAVRRYEVVRTRKVQRQQVEVMDQRRAGMTLIVCGTSENERTVVEAIYRPDPLSTTAGSVGASYTLPGPLRAQVRGVEVLTTTRELPPGMVALDVHVQLANESEGPIAWSDLGDQLELGGVVAKALPVSPRAPLAARQSRLEHFQYAVSAGGGAGTWRLTDVTGASIAVDVTVPAAQVAPALHGTIGAGDIRIRRTPAHTTIFITIQLEAHGDSAVEVKEEAVSITVHQQPLALATDSTPLPLLLRPGEKRPLTLIVELPLDARVLDVRLESQRWRVTLPPGS